MRPRHPCDTARLGMRAERRAVAADRETRARRRAFHHFDRVLFCPPSSGWSAASDMRFMCVRSSASQKWFPRIRRRWSAGPEADARLRECLAATAARLAGTSLADFDSQAGTRECSRRTTSAAPGTAGDLNPSIPPDRSARHSAPRSVDSASACGGPIVSAREAVLSAHLAAVLKGLPPQVRNPASSARARARRGMAWPASSASSRRRASKSVARIGSNRRETGGDGPVGTQSVAEKESAASDPWSRATNVSPCHGIRTRAAQDQRGEARC